MYFPLKVRRPRLRGVVAVAAVTAACVGAGGTALALDGASTPSSSTAAGSSGAPSHAAIKAGKLALGRISHGQFTVKRGTTFVTRDIANGTITRLSGPTLTVRAADGYTLTFVVNAKTKVRVRTAGHGTAGTLSALAVGDRVAVLGTGTGEPTANRIVEIVK